MGSVLGCADGVVGPAAVGVPAGGVTAMGTGATTEGPELGRAALSPTLGLAPTSSPAPA
ncbi:hypothetical protein [Streptacidiphilus neutrinimicus]|uniref:hypothetical protein n=1 Tax=Streptacidiphilus neutrinimicus TaxID=105420 RepID=UPI000AB7B742|nr:hypothetical protein [Streptacidiphilus neutrinimicus]